MIITFNKPVDDFDFIEKIGGKSFINSELWPIDEEGKYLTLVLTLPYTFLKNALGVETDDNTCISVFSTYSQDKDDYFLDKVIYNIEDEEELELIKRNTKVIYHKKAKESINLSDYLIPAMKIEITNEEDTSNINDKPIFLQEELSFSGYKYLLQFYAGDFPKGYENILYISDAIGYLFIKKKLVVNKEAGLYFGQCT